LSTLKSRLEQARERLRARLAARGLALPAALVASLFSGAAASAAVPPVLRDATVNAAVSKVAALTQGGLTAMLLSKLKIAGCFFLLALAGLVAYQALASEGQQEEAPG